MEGKDNAMEGKDNSHKTWANSKRPSMKRRSEQNDYTERGIYLVTLAIDGRRPLLGMLAGNTSVATKIPLKDKEDKPLKIKDLKGKKLTVLFTEPSEDKVDKSAVLAKTEVKL